MRSFVLALFVGLLAHGVAWRAVRASRAGEPRIEEARSLDRTLPRAIERISLSLLRVHPAGDSADLARRTRTAIAIDKDLAIMDAVSIAVTGVDDLVVEDAAGGVHKARMRGRDSRLRVVALEVDDGELVPAVRASRIPEAGTFVLAVGALSATESQPASVAPRLDASFGIVSAAGRFEGRALQVDCGIDPANAGGALIDLDGSLIGVPVLVDRKLGDDSGVGFAVPISRIQTVVERLRRGDDLQAGFMGIALPQEEPDAPPSLEGGVRIEGIVAEGPAAKAGLKVSDVIIGLDGQKVRSLRGLLALLSDRAAGDTVHVVVLREGREVPATVTLVGR